MTKTEFIKARLEFWKLLLSAFIVAGFSIVLVVLQTAWSYFVPSIIVLAVLGISFVYIGILYANDLKKLKELPYNE